MVILCTTLFANLAFLRGFPSHSLQEAPDHRDRATNSCLPPQAASDANITTGVHGASSSRRELMKVAQHFSAGGAVSKGIRPGGTIEMFELWPRMRGKASLVNR
jgi:hypothetical protein